MNNPASTAHHTNSLAINHRYGVLNERFDERVALLSSLGFTTSVVKLPSGTTVVEYFVPGPQRAKWTSILSCTIMHMEEPLWEQRIEEVRAVLGAE